VHCVCMYVCVGVQKKKCQDLERNYFRASSHIIVGVLFVYGRSLISSCSRSQNFPKKNEYLYKYAKSFTVVTRVCVCVPMRKVIGLNVEAVNSFF